MRKSSDARIRATNKYQAKAYERISISIPKGNKQRIQELAAAAGKTVNSYLNDLLANEVGEQWKRKYNEV